MKNQMQMKIQSRETTNKIPSFNSGPFLCCYINIFIYSHNRYYTLYIHWGFHMYPDAYDDPDADEDPYEDEDKD